MNAYNYSPAIEKFPIRFDVRWLVKLFKFHLHCMEIILEINLLKITQIMWC